MQKQIEKPDQDPEALLLARVYALILAWGELDMQEADSAIESTHPAANALERKDVKGDMHE